MDHLLECAAAFQDLFSLGGSTVDNEVGIFKSKRLPV